MEGHKIPLHWPQSFQTVDHHPDTWNCLEKMWVFSLLQTQTCGALTHWFAQTLFGFHLLSSALLSIKWPSGGFINNRSLREPAFCHYSLNNHTCIRLKQAGIITHQPGVSMFNSYLNSATLIYLPCVSMQRETNVIFQTQSQNSQQKQAVFAWAGQTPTCKIQCIWGSQFMKWLFYCLAEICYWDVGLADTSGDFSRWISAGRSKSGFVWSVEHVSDVRTEHRLCLSRHMNEITCPSSTVKQPLREELRLKEKIWRGKTVLIQKLLVYFTNNYKEQETHWINHEILK